MGTYVLISVLVLITCILLVLIVLAQNAKGGGLSSTFGSSNQQVMGVKKTSDFLEKTTWTLAIILLILSLSSTFVIPRAGDQQAEQSELQGMVPAEDAGPVDLSSPGGGAPADIPQDEQTAPVESPPDHPGQQEAPIDLPPEDME